jgi:transcriptional regulator with XRE-family HTH domain
LNLSARRNSLPPETRSPEALALLYLRSARGWSKKRLAAELGIADDRLISRYERGEKPLTRENLERMAACLGYSREAVEALLSVHSFLSPSPPEEDASPVALTGEELEAIDRTALTSGWTFAEDLRARLRRNGRATKAEEKRNEAGDLWKLLEPATREERRRLVAAFPDFRDWALAVRVCEESVRAAAHRVDKALELADLALFIAGRVPGEESWRSRLQGFAWAHVANAKRVANDFDGADEAFTRAWGLWQTGSDSALLPEWRLLDLEASLRREQHRFPEALDLLSRARVLCGSNKLAAARILLNKEHIYDQMGDTEGALAALAEATPFVSESRDPRLLFAHRFNTADNLCHLGRYTQAAKRLAEVRELAIEQANELDLIRVVWLEAKVASGQGKVQEAISRLEQVRQDFTSRDLPYDAARSSLDLALLWLQAGRTTEVRELVRGMAWIFASKKIHREALAALSLFCEAARQETATLELTRSVMAKIEEIRRSASRQGGRGRG